MKHSIHASKMKFFKLLSVVTVSSTIALTGCQVIKPTAHHNNQSIQPVAKKEAVAMSLISQDRVFDYPWQLVDVDNSKLTPVKGTKTNFSALKKFKDKAHITFNNNQGRKTISFTIGCNTIGSAITMSEKDLSMKTGMMRATRMYCEDLAQAEADISTAISGKTHLSVLKPVGKTHLVLKQTTKDNLILTWHSTAK